MNYLEYLEKVGKKVENDPANKIYLEKIRAIIERYIDENDAVIELRDNTLKIAHPVLRSTSWAPEQHSPEETAIIESLNNPDEMRKVQDVLKTAIKQELLQYSKWTSILNERLCFPYCFYVVKEAQEFMTTDNFTIAMSLFTYLVSHFNSYIDKIAPIKEEILEMLKACNPKQFGFEEIPSEEEITVYLDENALDDKSEASFAFFWIPSRKDLIDYFELVYDGYEDCGAYTAKIRREDIFGCFDQVHYNEIVLNPDKLYDIKYVQWVTDLFSKYELPQSEDYYAEEDDDEDWDND